MVSMVVAVFPLFRLRPLCGRTTPSPRVTLTTSAETSTGQPRSDKQRVRTGLAAGGRWIRTSGSAPAATPLTDRTRAIAPLVFVQSGPDQPSVARIPVHKVGDSSASMAPPSQVKGCPPNRVNSSLVGRRPQPLHEQHPWAWTSNTHGLGMAKPTGNAPVGAIGS